MPAGGAAGAKRAAHTASANLRHQAEQTLVEKRGAKHVANINRGAKHLRAASPKGPFRASKGVVITKGINGGYWASPKGRPEIKAAGHTPEHAQARLARAMGTATKAQRALLAKGENKS